MKKIIFCILICLAMTACGTDDVLKVESNFVVEGWIDSGKNPIVFITSQISATDYSKKESTELSSLALDNAKVSVICNGDTTALDCVESDEYFLPCHYTSSRITGETGKEYTLLVECNGKKATAKARIPQPSQLVSLMSVASEQKPDKYAILASFYDNPATHDYYKFFVRVYGKESCYAPSYMGNIDDEGRDELINFIVERGNHLPELHTDYFYEKGDTVAVKFATMESGIYDFWSKFDQNAMCLTMPFKTYYGNCVGNVDGALGYWAGYGINEYQICIE